MKCVIIGNSASGISAAEAIRARLPESEIVIVGAEPLDAYVRPRIPELLSGENAESLRFKSPDFYDNKRIKLYKGVQMSNLDAQQKCVHLSDGSNLCYDALLLCYGARPVIPQLPGVELSNVQSFTTMQDAEYVLQNLSKTLDTVIIGAGLIGLEVAERLIEKGCRVTLLERSQSMLPALLPPAAGKRLLDHCRKNGAEVRLGVNVEGFDGDDGMLKAVRLQGGERVECELCIVSIGTRADVSLPRQAGIAVDRGVLVDRHMRTGAPDVYAAGDCAQIENVTAAVGLWANAVMQGKIAGANMAGEEAQYVSHMTSNNRTLMGIQVATGGKSVAADGMRLALVDGNETRSLTLCDGEVAGYARVGEPGNVQPLLKLMGKKLSDTQTDSVLKAPLSELAAAVQSVGK